MSAQAYADPSETAASRGRVRPVSAEQAALARWSLRQMRLAQNVADCLYEMYRHDDFRWETSDNLFGTPVDSAVIVGRAPDGSGLLIVGDMEDFSGMFQEMLLQKLQLESAARRIDLLDPRWGPLPLPYYLTQSFQEMDMPLTQQDLSNIAATVAAANQGFTPAWKQTLTLCGTVAIFALGCVGWWTSELHRVEDKIDTRMTGMEDKLTKQDEKWDARMDSMLHGINDVKIEMSALNAKLEERLPKPGPFSSSVDTHSSTPPKAKGGSPTP